MRTRRQMAAVALGRVSGGQGDADKARKLLAGAHGDLAKLQELMKPGSRLSDEDLAALARQGKS